ncbi:hypothetical protein COCNU_scaffold000446G000020 [Cocos nucifera]|nr:hypothetical protein [Cocos nucifera]
MYRAPPLLDLLKEHTLFNLGLSSHDPAGTSFDFRVHTVLRTCIAIDYFSFPTTEMDAQVAKMLTEWLFTRKRKGKVQEDSSKRVKVGVSCSEVSTPTVAAFEVIVGIKIFPAMKVDTASSGPMPFMSSGPSNGDWISKPLSNHQMLAHIKRVRRQEAKAQKAQEDLRVKVRHLQERVDEVEHLAKEKATDIESLQDVLHEKEFTSARLKATLALEEERRKEAENRVTELEIQMVKSISEAMTQTMVEFKTSLDMRNLNVDFG